MNLNFLRTAWKSPLAYNPQRVVLVITTILVVLVLTIIWLVFPSSLQATAQLLLGGFYIVGLVSLVLIAGVIGYLVPVRIQYGVQTRLDFELGNWATMVFQVLMIVVLAFLLLIVQRTIVSIPFVELMTRSMLDNPKDVGDPTIIWLILDLMIMAAGDFIYFKNL